MAAQTDILLEAGTNELEIVEFWLEEEPREEGEGNYRGFYGVNVAKVLEIIRIPDRITKLPKVAHPAIMGTFNLRNKVIPLVDLSHWLKKPRVETEPPKVIVTEFNNVSSAFWYQVLQEFTGSAGKELKLHPTMFPPCPRTQSQVL